MISKKTAQRLVELFAGEVLVFYLKDMKVSTVSEDGEHLSLNGMVDGLVIDIDEHYYYLGDDEGNVEKAIRHEIVAIVEVAKYEPEFHIELPSDEDEVH